MHFSMWFFFLLFWMTCLLWKNVKFLKPFFLKYLRDISEQHPNTLTVLIASSVLGINSLHCWNVKSFPSYCFGIAVTASESTLLASKITPKKYLKRTNVIYLKRPNVSLRLTKQCDIRINLHTLHECEFLYFPSFLSTHECIIKLFKLRIVLWEIVSECLKTI